MSKSIGTVVSQQEVIEGLTELKVQLTNGDFMRMSVPKDQEYLFSPGTAVTVQVKRASHGRPKGRKNYQDHPRPTPVSTTEEQQ